jgi:hypothetical protein
MHRASPSLPTSGYALIVDGHIKNEFKTKEAAEKGAKDLKSRFPMLQIKVYNAEAKVSEEIALASGLVDTRPAGVAVCRAPHWTVSGF